MSNREFTAKSTGVVVAASIGLLFSVGPMIASTFGIFMTAFGHAYGWSRSGFSAVILVTTIVGSIGTPIAGRAIDRLGVRRVILPGVLGFGLAMAAVSLVQGQLWQLYLAYAVVGIFAGVQNAVAYSKLLSQWFQRNRGKVLAIMSTASGISYGVMPQIARGVIASSGWRSAYLVMGGLCVASLLILIPLLRQPTAADGLATARRATESEAGETLAEARRTPTFWLLGILLFLGVASLVGTTAHIFPMLVDRGIPGTGAASVMSMLALGTIIGQVTYGFLLDRFDTPKVALPYFIASLIGMTMVHRLGTLSQLLPGALLMGTGQGAELGLAAYFVGRYFGTRHFGSIYGFIYAGASLAAGVGPVLFGLSFDTLGGYAPIMLASEIAIVGVIIGMAILPRYRFARIDQSIVPPAAPTSEPVPA